MKKFTSVFAAVALSLTASAQWDTLSTQSMAHFNGISFHSRDTGMTVGKNPATGFGEIRMTTDEGVSWMAPAYPAGLPGFNAVYCSSFQKSWIVGDSGCVLHSVDAGMTWTALPRFTAKHLNTVFFLDDSTGFVAGADGVLFKTSNEGATWDTLTSGTVLDINAVLMITTNAGWVAGDGGYVAYTSDAGQTWSPVAHPLFGFFHCNGIAHTTTILDAFAVGDDGLAISSNDAGATWNDYPTSTLADLNAVRFTNSIAGLVCGGGGLIWRTADAGATWWNESMAAVTDTLNDIAFTADTIAYICGNNGRVLKSRTDISSVPQPENGVSISAYPNPFSGELNIAVRLANASDVQLFVTDISGRVVAQENIGGLSAGTQAVRADLSALVPGMYFVRVSANGAFTTVPVVKR